MLGSTTQQDTVVSQNAQSNTQTQDFRDAEIPALARLSVLLDYTPIDYSLWRAASQLTTDSRSSPKPDPVLRNPEPRKTIPFPDSQPIRQVPTPQLSLPYSLDAEKGLLGSMLLAPNKVRGIIEPEAFFYPAYQTLYNVLHTWPDPTKTVDHVWLKEVLKTQELLEECGGWESVAELYSFVPCSDNAAYYAGIVSEHYERRQTIQACLDAARRCQDLQEMPDLVIRETQEALAKAIRGTDGATLSGRTLLDLLELNIDPASNLLGNRWLTREGSAFFIAPSGHGKSSFVMQSTLGWAVGRIAFGIKPAQPWRILIVQSEDDDAESKKFAQMIRTMNLSEAERAMLRENTRFEFRRDISGDRFIQALDQFLTEWPADIVVINPLSGFLLCDLKDDDKVNHFLRGKLTPLMAKHHCAPVVVHHTPKINFQQLDKMKWYDWMYVMSGCAGLTNWGRAVLVIAPTNTAGIYRFIAAKRFDEIQWTEREYWFAHSRKTLRVDDQEYEILEWIPASQEQIAAIKPAPKGQKATAINAQALWEQMSPLKSYTREQWQEWAKAQFGVGQNKAWGLLKILCEEDRASVVEEKRAGTNNLKVYRKLET